MTLEEFQALQVLQDRRVRMNFIDGQILIATLTSITTDFDESRHIIYDNVEWSALAHPQGGNTAFYSAGEDLISCVEYNAEAELSPAISSNLPTVTSFTDAAHVYRISLACSSVPASFGESGATDIQQEFAARPSHENVRCVWDGKELLLHAESDWDTDGKALVDEFSDVISACIAGAFDGEIEVRSISLMPERS